MTRRRFLSGVAVAGISLSSGCLSFILGRTSVDGEVVVNKTLYSATDGFKTYRFDAEEDQTINIYVDNHDGFRTTVGLIDPDGEEVHADNVATENTTSHTARMTGSYGIDVYTEGGCMVVVGIED